MFFIKQFLCIAISFVSLFFLIAELNKINKKGSKNAFICLWLMLWLHSTVLSIVLLVRKVIL